MISRMFVIILVAILFYAVLPAVNGALVRRTWRRRIADLKGGTGIAAAGTGIRAGLLTVRNGDTEELAIPPRKTRFLILRQNGELEELAWSAIKLVQTGISVFYVRTGRGHRDLCLFHGEGDQAALRARIGALEVPERVRNPGKRYWVGAGAFLEFLVFLDTTRYPELNTVSIAALVAIFGKALPYCPPGLFFTLASYSITGRLDGTKKNRQHGATGFLLILAGIALNVAGLFFVIRRVVILLP